MPANLEHIPTLEGERLLDVEKMNDTGFRLHIPVHLPVFETISAGKCYRRRKGGGRVNTPPPRIIISPAWLYAAYSEARFVIAPRQVELAVPLEDSEYLKALSLYLNTSLVYYYLFFQTSDWGIERDRVNLANVKNIPVPRFSNEQVAHLARIHQQYTQYELSGQRSEEFRREIDSKVAEVLSIPEDVLAIAQDFVYVKFTLNEGRTDTVATQFVAEHILVSYANRLRFQLDNFMDGSGFRHKVEIQYSRALVNCKVELVKSDNPFSISVRSLGDPSQSWVELDGFLVSEYSQWAYVQKRLRIFDGPRVSFFKSSRVIDWTETQAFVDADDLIEYILCAEEV